MYEELVNRLNSRSRSVRETAERQLATLSATGLAAAAVTALRMQRERAWRLRRFAQYCVIPMAGMVTWGWVRKVESLKNLAGMFGTVLGFLNIASTVPSRASLAVARTCKQVEAEDSPRIALALLENWAARDVNRAMPTTSADLAFKADVGEVIKNGLNNLSREAALSLTPGQCGVVAWLLRSPMADPELTLAALRVLEIAGGRAELPLVRKVASMRKFKETRRNLAEAASACAAAIETRLVSRRNVDTLLRAAGPGQPATDLLRPASNLTAPHESVLVRPVDAS